MEFGGAEEGLCDCGGAFGAGCCEVGVDPAVGAALRVADADMEGGGAGGAMESVCWRGVFPEEVVDEVGGLVGEGFEEFGGVGGEGVVEGVDVDCGVLGVLVGAL